MKTGAKTVASYLASLPEDRRAAIAAVRDVIRKNLDADYEEGIQYGMIGYYVPHKVYPRGYHVDPKQPLPFAALASQKNHMSLYLMGVYCGCTEGKDGETEEARWFREAWSRTGKKLDMGRSCVRFKKLENVALEVVGEAIRRIPASTYIARYESVLGEVARGKKKAAPKKASKAAPPRRKARSTAS
ncbi:MAG TPA: DUF1801 domain-containing protein [Polyangiaceae bacterium]|nr:DUF1801 domain-containing protein [Polyangiaceae bacterium]